MNDKPENIWKRPVKGWKLFVIRLAVLACLCGLAFLATLGFASSNNSPPPFIPVVWVVSIGITLIFVFGWLFIHSLYSWRNFKRFLLGVACFAALIALFYAEEDWRGKHDWDKFKRQWEAKGERFDVASVVPSAVPDDQNYAMAPIFDAVDKSMSQKWRTQHENPHYGKDGDFMPWDTNIVDRLDMGVTYDDQLPPTNGIGDWQSARMSDLTSWQDYYRTLAAKTNLFPVASQPQTPAQDVLLALSKYNSTIEELQEASRRPYSRFPLDYDDENPAEILLPHLADLKRCSQVLQLHALAELQNNQNDKALANVKLILYLANSLRTEPILISHLVRIAIVSIALQPIWEGMAEHKWSDAQLAELDSELAKFNFLSSYQTTMRGEMVLFQGGIFDYLRRHPERLYGLFALSESGNSLPPVPARIIARLIPRGWFYQNQLNCARMILEFDLPVVNPDQRTVSPSAVRKADTAAQADVRHVGPYNIFERMLLPALGAASKKFAWAQESVDLARVAIALERYRLAHGKYPASLDALAPHFMAKIPHDIINGEPLHYRRRDDGQFVLYSVGWNETDDGGVVGLYKGSLSRIDISQGDWVWRYPAR